MARYHAFSFIVMLNVLEGTPNPGVVAQNVKDAIQDKLDDMNQQAHFFVEVDGGLSGAEEMYEPDEEPMDEEE